MIAKIITAAAITLLFTPAPALFSQEHPEHPTSGGAKKQVSTADISAGIKKHITAETSKSGVAPGDALVLARAVVSLPRLALRGFMGIAAPTAAVELQRAQFRMLREILAAARAEGLMLDTLSMGMSDDLEAAIAEGATLIRVGSAWFGPRA